MENSQNQPIIWGIGNTFIDWYAEATQELLDKYGLAFGVPGELTEEQIPILKDLESMKGYHEMPGGSTINTIRAINYHMGKEQERDGTTLYFGSIAKDEKGATIKQLLEEETIHIRMNEHDSGYTGQCAIVIVKGERTPVSNSGVNNCFETKHFEDNIDSLSFCKIIYVEGFFTSSNFEVIRKAFQYAKDNNKLFAFNLWGEYWVETYKERFIEIIPNCDLLFGNLVEFQTLAKILEIEYESPADLIQKIAS